MNKKGGIWGILITIGIVIFIALILISTYNIVYPQGQKAIIDYQYHKIESKYLDVSFEFLFGKNFQDSIGVIAGTNERSTGFFNDLATGFGAAILLILSTWAMSMIKLLGMLFGKKRGMWFAKSFVHSRRGIVRYVGLIVVFPVLMQLPIINRVVQIVTFYWFLDGLMYCLVLAVYVGYLPELIEAIIRYRYQAAAQKKITETITGMQMAQAMGKAK